MVTHPAVPVPVFTFVETSTRETVVRLDDIRPRIAGLAAQLRDQMEAGAIVGLMFRSEPILVLSWLACLHAGLRPLVMQYPTKKQSREYWTNSVGNTVERAGLAAVLCDAYCEQLGLGQITRAVVLPAYDAIAPAAAGGTVESLLPQDFAIVQLSSGTTGHRKAVEFRSDELRRHAADFNQVLQLDPKRDRVVSWLPLYHDMGYVACFVMPLLLGIDVVMIDPMVWVREPSLLFHAIEKHAGTIAYMPNFGFEVMSRCEPRQLPTMRFWVSCSEPVSPLTSRRFVERIGAPEQSFSACYAMAENIFAVSMSRGLRTAEIDGRDVVSCGMPIPGVEMKVFEDELWVRSPTSLRNYMGGDDIRDAEGYYPTGDLGSLIDGEVFVTGRKQDLIIQAGRKFMLSDIDLAVNEAFPEVKGRVATVQTYDERLGTQKPLILIEANDFFMRRDRDAVADAVREATGLDQVEVAFVPPRFLTKTSSGKINRKKSAQDWAAHLAAKAGGAVKEASVASELAHYFEHVAWDRPVQEFMDSLSLTILRIILNDAGVAYVPTACLNDFVNQGTAKPAAAASDEYLYIVSLVDRGTVKYVRPAHVEALSRRLGVPVVIEHVCLPPSPVTLSDLIFQDYFLPRLDREDYAVVERQLNKLRRASIILVDDVAEMVFPPAQVYGVLSHNLERDPRANLVTVRWQRYPQLHHKLPVTVVAGSDLALRHRTDTLDQLSAYLDTPVFRIAGLRNMVEFTQGWDYNILERQAESPRPRLLAQPGDLVQELTKWVQKLPKPPRRLQGMPANNLEMSDLAHFCSRYVDSQAVDAVLNSYDRFCIVGQECSVPYVAQRLTAMGKSFVRSPSYNEAAIGGIADQYDCVIVCGAQGRYTLDKPGVALMAADPPQDVWNLPPGSPLAELVFVVPMKRAPVSGLDWFYPHPMERGEDDEVFQGLRSGLRKVAEAKRTRVARQRQEADLPLQEKPVA